MPSHLEASAKGTVQSKSGAAERSQSAKKGSEGVVPVSLLDVQVGVPLHEKSQAKVISYASNSYSIEREPDDLEKLAVVQSITQLFFKMKHHRDACKDEV